MAQPARGIDLILRLLELYFSVLHYLVHFPVTVEALPSSRPVQSVLEVSRVPVDFHSLAGTILPRLPSHPYSSFSVP